MKKYDKYKDSGVSWIGEIPDHWEVVKLGWCFNNIGSGTTPKSDKQEEYYDNGNHNWLLTGDLNDGEIYETSKKITDKAIEDYSTLKVYPINSIVIAMYGATIGKLGILKTPTSVNQACCVFSDSKQSYYKYIFYTLLSAKNEIINLSNGGGQPNVSQELLKNIIIQIPPKEEQTAIADYLDRKTAEIDQIIQDKQRLIELYKEEKTAIINQAVTKGINPNIKLKDSGIEWLGEIPEHWEVKRLRHVCKIFGRIGYRGYKVSDLVPKGEGAITISPSNMKDYYMDFDNSTYLSWSKYEESPEIKIYNDDILFVKTGSSYGKSTIVKELNEKATINPQIIVLKDIDVNKDFLWYIMKSENILYQVERTVVGGTIPTISQAKINNYRFSMPLSHEEQSEIVSYIEKETAEIDQKIEKAEKYIALLSEYRTALISEVVTGKIKVVE